MGVDHLIPPGMGKELHIDLARRLPSPFAVSAPLDLDLDFALTAVAIFGVRIHVWREQQARIVQQVIQVLAPFQAHLSKHKVTTAKAVADAKHVALMALFIALLSWPDRTQPMAYLTGFQVIGDIPATGIFRPIEGLPVDTIDDDFFGLPAEQAVTDLLTSKPPQDHEDIYTLTCEEIGKGYSSKLLSLTQVNNMFGSGLWRPIHRFLVHQADGKKRLIDDGRRGRQNAWAGMYETIFSIGVDFVPQVAAALRDRLSELYGDSNDHEWADLNVAIADLPEACRSLPVAPDDRRAAVVAIFDGDRQQWRFTVMAGCPFGLGSVVVHFNRSQHCLPP